MAKTKVDISTEQNLIVDGVTTQNLSKRFGRVEDYIELHIYNNSGDLLESEENFEDFSSPGTEGELTTELNMDPAKILHDRGYTSGKYKLSFNVLKRKIINSQTPQFTIKEISSTRTELRTIVEYVQNRDLEGALRGLIGELRSNPFYKDLVINFGEDQLFTCVNVDLNKRSKKFEVLFKLFEPLPTSFRISDKFGVAENIVDKINVDVNLGLAPIDDDRIDLRGPNFKIDTRLNNSVPSAFKNYNEILNYNATSSYEQLLNQLENKEVPDIDYTLIKTTSGSTELDPPRSYHFENFIHFSSAVERLKNFEYKVKLIELYDQQINEINTITGPTSHSAVVLTDKDNIYKKKENLIKGFDGYERFLYYTSGSIFTWPKQNTTSPFTLYSVSSSQAKTWLGNEKFGYPNYGGQLLSASLFDGENIHKISNLVPVHIRENPDNNNFSLFTDMIGQQFDHIWTHIKHLTEVNDTHHTRGVSSDLVYFQLKSLGIEAFDQFENADLIEYILGHGTGSSTHYSAPATQTLVTASNVGSVAKQDITKSIWKRLYHNAPYLLKTKGTERGLRALMSCYGIPATLLNVKEYGGSTSDKSTFKTFSYEKGSLALKGDSGTNGFFIKYNYSSSAVSEKFESGAFRKQTFEFRVKPFRSVDNYHLWSLSGSNGNLHDQYLLLSPHTGNDVSSSGDFSQYGSLQLYNGQTLISSTIKFPIYNGDFWNVFIKAERDEDGINPNHTASIEFGAYQANFNKNVFNYTASGIIHGTAGDFNQVYGKHKNRAKFTFIGGMPANPNSNFDLVDGLRYSGSLQEVRLYLGESLTDSTLRKHALEPFMYAGNSISSSYDNLILRLPLGSNDKQDSGSFHPNIDVNFLGGGTSSMSTQTWEEIVENHHLPTPDTVGSSMTSEKVRRDTGTIDDNILSIIKKSETSTLDRQPQDFEDLGVFFSPTTELNEDIVYQLGAFRLDDYIGSPLPSAQTSSNYPDLKEIRDLYFKRVKRRYGYWDYTKIVQYIDHTLFKLVEQFVPMKANLKTGLLFEPHYLERNKFARELPVVEEGTTMTPGSHQTLDFQIDPERQFTLGGSSVITTNNPSPITGSKGQRQEQGTNATIDIDDYVLDEVQNASQAPIKPFKTTKPAGYKERKSSVLLGNAVKGKISSIYYRSLDKGKELEY